MAWEAWRGRFEKNSTEGAPGGCSRGDGSAWRRAVAPCCPAPLPRPAAACREFCKRSIWIGGKKRGVCSWALAAAGQRVMYRPRRAAASWHAMQGSQVYSPLVRWRVVSVSCCAESASLRWRGRSCSRRPGCCLSCLLLR